MTRTVAVPPVAGRPLQGFSPEEFHAHVKAMHCLRQRGSSAKPKKAPAVAGLKVARTKKGAVSVKMLSKFRAFEYVTELELRALVTESGFTYKEIWEAFRKRKFLIAKSRMEAEKIYSATKEIPS